MLSGSDVSSYISAVVTEYSILTSALRSLDKCSAPLDRKDGAVKTQSRMN